MSEVKKRKIGSLQIILYVITGMLLITSIAFFSTGALFWFGVGFLAATVIMAIPTLIVSLWHEVKPEQNYLALNGRRFDAVIFDMDGTLIDSTSLWHEIDKKFFSKRGMELPNDYAQNIVHLGLKEAAKFTKNTYGIKESEQEIMDEWHQMSIDMYANDVKLKDYSLALLEFFRKNNIPMAIATANDDTLYMPCIKRLGLDKYFTYIADVNNVKEGKHSARIYEYLAEQMHVDKERVLVLEDMPTCVKTAYKAGFLTVAVNDKASEQYNKEKRMNSHLFINNFGELLNLLK